jgi:two-component system, chemotaxis family, chemotaxis protein CheY
MDQESEQSAVPSDAMVDQIELSQEVIQGLLELLGDAWAENERLQALYGAPSNAAGQAHPLPQPRHDTPTAQESPHGVLIVDDSRVLQARLKSTVESLGYEVAGVAADGRSGAEMALLLNPRMAILDYDMPVANGLDFLQMVRPHLPNLNVIVCSAGLTAATSRAFARLGVQDIILKPVQLNVLVNLIRRGMGDV